MSLMKRGKYYLAICFVFILSLVVGSFLVQPTIAKDLDKPSEKPITYSVNENGQTYGSSLYAESIEQEPDLIAAVNDEGIRGYILKSDMLGPEPKSREEAIAMMNKDIKSGGYEISLYAVDGKTVVGKFKVSPGKGKVINK